MLTNLTRLLEPLREAMRSDGLRPPEHPIVDVREGYADWVRTYEETVPDEMDLRLLERLTTVDWRSARAVLDLACGTGRVGAWLEGRGGGRRIH